MEINNKLLATTQNRERLDNAVAHRKRAKRNSAHQQGLFSKLVSLANDKLVTKSAGNTPCGSPLNTSPLISPRELSPRCHAKSETPLPCRSTQTTTTITTTTTSDVARTPRRISSPTHQQRLNALLLQQQQQPLPLPLPQPREQALTSRRVLKTTSSRHLLARFDYNRHENDKDSDSITNEEEAESDNESSSLGEDFGEKTLTLDLAQVQLLKERLQAYRDDYETTMTEEEEEEREFKPATPSNRHMKRSEIVLSPRIRILQAGFAAYKRYPNGIVNFVRTDIHVDNWRFCYVCNLDSPHTRYIRQLTLTEIKRNYAGFAECQIYRIVKFCATCFQCYNEAHAKEPDRPLLVRITPNAANLFCPL